MSQPLPPPRFAVGDTVFVFLKTYTYPPCTACKGKGPPPGFETFICSRCHGDGKSPRIHQVINSVTKAVVEACTYRETSSLKGWIFACRRRQSGLRNYHDSDIYTDKATALKALSKLKT